MSEIKFLNSCLPSLSSGHVQRFQEFRCNICIPRSFILLEKLVSFWQPTKCVAFAKTTWDVVFGSIYQDLAEVWKDLMGCVKRVSISIPRYITEVWIVTLPPSMWMESAWSLDIVQEMVITSGGPSYQLVVHLPRHLKCDGCWNHQHKLQDEQ